MNVGRMAHEENVVEEQVSEPDHEAWWFNTGKGTGKGSGNQKGRKGENTQSGGKRGPQGKTGGGKSDGKGPECWTCKGRGHRSTECANNRKGGPETRNAYSLDAETQPSTEQAPEPDSDSQEIVAWALQHEPVEKES